MPTSADVPESFRRTVANTFGEAGAQWLRALPRLVSTAAERWDLTGLRPFPNLSYNYVAAAQRAGGQAVVLKLGVPNPELTTEVLALRFFDGRGAVRLLDAELQEGMLLLERLQPGHTLLRLSLADDDEATRIAAQVMQQLWRPAPGGHALPTIGRWARGFDRLRRRFAGGTGPFPARAVAEAEAIYRGYPAASQGAFVLHGDLHHMNILAAGDEYRAIDPKGVVGDKAYEAGALLRNPVPHVFSWPDVSAITARRAAILAEMLGLEQRAIVGWAYAQAVLSAWWSFEDNDPDWTVVLSLVAAMETLR